MTGNELLYWLSDLWYDLSHLGQADLLSLAWRLAVVLLVVRLVYGMLQRPLTRFVSVFRWWLRYPARQIRRRQQKNQQQRDRELWELREQAEQERREAEAEAGRKRAAEEREAIQKALSLDD